MEVAILSDVHGNLEALTAVVEELERQCIRRVLFLGDAVGYGADPEPCLEILEKLAGRFVAGNHDQAAAIEEESLEYFSEEAAAGIRWTREALSPQGKDRLRRLPLDCLEGEMHLVHGSPHQPDRWHYVMAELDAEKGFAASDARVIFVGHSHVPAAFIEVECRRLFTGVMRRVRAAQADSLRAEPRYRYIVNVGSVGQPRDGDPRACYATYDRESGACTLHRVAYDVERAAEKIKKAGLPPGLAERLQHGS